MRARLASASRGASSSGTGPRDSCTAPSPPHYIPRVLRAEAALEDVRRTATRRGRAALGAFATEGLRLLERGLRAGRTPRQVLIGASLRQAEPALPALLARLEAEGCPWLELPDARLLELAEGRRSGLCTALFELPPAQGLPEWLAARPPGALLLGLVDVREPGNVGALVRTALASAAAGVICAGDSDPYHPKAVRTSLGSVFKLPCLQVHGEPGLVDELRALGVHCLAAVARGGERLRDARWPERSLALFVGNEGQGLAAGFVARVDGSVRIDLSAELDSYSVNAAAAICLYEIQRRRRP